MNAANQAAQNFVYIPNMITWGDLVIGFFLFVCMIILFGILSNTNKTNELLEKQLDLKTKELIDRNHSNESETLGTS